MATAMNDGDRKIKLNTTDPDKSENSETEDPEEQASAGGKKDDSPLSSLKISIQGLEKDLAGCEKPKCRALRCFVLARLCALVGDKAKAVEYIQSSGSYLNQCEETDDDSKLRKRILGLLVSHLTSLLIGDLPEGDAVCQKTSQVHECSRSQNVFDKESPEYRANSTLWGGYDDDDDDDDGGSDSEDDDDNDERENEDVSDENENNRDEESENGSLGDDCFIHPVFEQLKQSTPLDRAMYYYLKGRFHSYVYHGFGAAVRALRKSVEESPESSFALVALASNARICRRAVDRFRMPWPCEYGPLLQKLGKTKGRDMRALSRMATIEMERLWLLKNAEAPIDRLTYDEIDSRWEKILRLAEIVERDGKKAKDFTFCADIFSSSPKKFDKQFRAENMYRRALELDPSDSFTNHKFGKFLAKNGKIEEGLAHLRNAVEEASFGNLPAHMDYVNIRYCVEGDRFDADVEFEKILEIKARSPMRLNLLVVWAQYKATKKDFDAAVGMLDEVAETQARWGHEPYIKYDPFPASQWAFLLDRKEDEAPDHPRTQQSEPSVTRSKGWETKASDLLWRRGVPDGKNQQAGSRGFSNTAAGWNGNPRGNSWRGSGSTAREGDVRSSSQPKRCQRQFTPRKTLVEIREEIEEKARRHGFRRSVPPAGDS